MNDQKLLSGLKKGDRKIILAIYNNYSPKVTAWITKNSGTKSDAYDIFQDSLETLILKIDSINSSFESLLMKIVKYKWIDQLRKNKKDSLAKETLKMDLSMEEKSAVDNHQKFKMMDEAFVKLSELCQQLIEGLKQGENTQELMKRFKFNSANTLYRRKAACIERWSRLVKSNPNFKELMP